MSSNLSLILSVLGIVGIGLYFAKKVFSPPVGARREHEREVKTQERLDAIAEERISLLTNGLGCIPGS